jgi:hypothetical protein
VSTNAARDLLPKVTFIRGFTCLKRAGHELADDRCVELVERRWAPIPPERCTDEHKQRETQRLCNELGRRLDVGDSPRLPPRSNDWYWHPN